MFFHLNHLRFMACYMAVNIDRTWHTCDMCSHGFNVQTNCCCLSAKSLRSNTQFVYFFQHFFFKVCIERIWIFRIDRTHQCFFSQQCCFIKSSSDTNTYNHRRAWIRTCCFYRLKDKIFDSLKSGRWFEHADRTHVFTSETFWSYCDLDLLARNDFCVDHSRCIITCISSADRIFYNGFSQITFVISAAYTFVDRICKISAFFFSPPEKPTFRSRSA